MNMSKYVGLSLYAILLLLFFFLLLMLRGHHAEKAWPGYSQRGPNKKIGTAPFGRTATILCPN